RGAGGLTGALRPGLGTAGGLRGVRGGNDGRRLGGKRSGSCYCGRSDGKRCCSLGGWLGRGSRPPRSCGSRDGNGNGVGRHHGRSILRDRDLISCPGTVVGRCLRRLVGLRAIGLRRVGLRFGAAGRRGLGVGIGPGIGIGLGVDFVVIACFVAACLGRGVAIIRIVARDLVRFVRCGGIVARAVVGRGLRIVGAARRGRVVLGAI